MKYTIDRMANMALLMAGDGECRTNEQIEQEARVRLRRMVRLAGKNLNGQYTFAEWVEMNASYELARRLSKK